MKSYGKETNFFEQKNNFKNLKLQESISSEIVNRPYLKTGRSISPPIINEKKTPMKLLHYHKKKGSVNPIQSTPMVACSLSKYGSKKLKDNLILNALDSNDWENYQYLDVNIGKPRNFTNEYEFINRGDNFYHKRRTNIKMKMNQHLTQTNSPQGYFNNSQKSQLNYGKSRSI